MNKIKTLLGQRIRELRKINNLTQEQLSEKIGIEIPSLSNIENGKNYPNHETIEKIAGGLNVRIFELYIFEHLMDEDDDEILKQLNNILRKNKKLLKTIYKIARILSKESA